MVDPTELMAAVVEATAMRRLQPRDSAVMNALIAHVNWRSGRIAVTGTHLAELLRMKQQDVSASIKRLRQEKLLARVVDPVSRNTFFLINPRLLWVGSTQRRGHLFQQFDEAIHVPKLEELEESAARRLQEAG